MARNVLRTPAGKAGWQKEPTAVPHGWRQLPIYLNFGGNFSVQQMLQSCFNFIFNHFCIYRVYCD